MKNENNLKYKFTLCVLACTKKEKYANRLKDYIESYGYKLNNRNNSIKFVFLVEDEPRPSFLNKDQIWVNCPNLPISMRWIKYLKETEIDSEWVMQVDDDSSTDIDKTIELLDQYYDSNDSMILMGGRNTDLELGQQNAMRSMKIENLFFESKDLTKFDGIPYFIHAWEPSIISKNGIKKIKNWQRLEEYYNLCKNIKPVFTDQTPYVVAKLAKIPIVECSFLCPFDWAGMYSGINKNGRYSHIHYVTEKWHYFDKFKKAMKEKLCFENEKETKNYLSTGIQKEIKTEKIKKEINLPKKQLKEEPIKNTIKNNLINNDVYIKFVNKINPKNNMIVKIFKDGQISVNNDEMLWQPSGNNRIAVLNKFTKKKIGDIIENNNTKEYFAVLNVEGKTSTTAWIGKKYLP